MPTEVMTTAAMDYKKVAAVVAGVVAIGVAAGVTYWIIKKRRVNKADAVNPVDSAPEEIPPIPENAPVEA